MGHYKFLIRISICLIWENMARNAIWGLLGDLLIHTFTLTKLNWMHNITIIFFIIMVFTIHWSLSSAIHWLAVVCQRAMDLWYFKTNKTIGLLLCYTANSCLVCDSPFFIFLQKYCFLDFSCQSELWQVLLMVSKPSHLVLFMKNGDPLSLIWNYHFIHKNCIYP